MKKFTLGSSLQFLQYSVLNSVYYPTGAALMIEFVSRIQILSLVFLAAYIKDDFSEYSDPIVDLIHYSTLAPTLLFNSSGPNTVLCILCIGYMILQMSFTIACLIAHFTSKLTDQMAKVLNISLKILSKITICPLLLTIFSLFHNFNKCSQSNNGLECQFWITILNMVLMPFMVGLALSSELLQNKNLDCKDRFCAKSTFSAVLNVLNKIVLSIILGLEMQDGINLFSHILNIIFLTFDLYYLKFKMPSFHPCMIRLQNILTGVSFANALCLIPNQFSRTQQTTFLVYICSTISIKIMQIHTNKTFQLILDLQSTDLNEILSLPRLVQASLANGIVLDTLKTEIPETLLSAYGRAVFSKIPLPTAQNEEGMRAYKYEIWKATADYMIRMRPKFQHSQSLQLAIAQVKYKRLQNMAGAFLIIKGLEKKGVSRDIRVAIKILTSKMSNKIRHLPSSFDNERAVEFFKYYKIVNEFQMQAQQEIEKQVELWRYFCVEKASANKICKKIIEIAKMARKINKRIEKMEEIIEQFYETALVYGAYLLVVKEKPEGKRWIERFFNSQRKRQINSSSVKWFDYHNPNQSLVVVSIEPENSGQILESSQSFIKMFEYSQKAQHKDNIAHFMPQIMKSEHEKALSDYRTNETALNPKRSIAKTLTGEYFEAEIRLKLSPSLDRGLQMVGLIRRLAKSVYMIFVDSNDKIVECSDEISNIFSPYHRNQSFMDIVFNYREINQKRNPAQSRLLDIDQPATPGLSLTAKSQKLNARNFSPREGQERATILSNTASIIKNMPQLPDSKVAFDYHTQTGQRVIFEALLESWLLFDQHYRIYKIDIDNFKKRNAKLGLTRKVVVSRSKILLGVNKKEEELPSEFADEFPEDLERDYPMRKVKANHTTSIMRDLQKDWNEFDDFSDRDDDDEDCVKTGIKRRPNVKLSLVGTTATNTTTKIIKDIQDQFQKKTSTRPYMCTRYFCIFSIVMVQVLLIIYFATSKSTLSLIDYAGIVSVESSIRCLFLLWTWRTATLYYANLIGYTTIGDQALPLLKQDLRYYNKEWQYYTDHLYQDLIRVVTYGSQERQWFEKHMVLRMEIPQLILDQFDGCFAVNSAFFEMIDMTPQEIIVNRDGWMPEMINFTINDVLTWSDDSESKVKAQLLQTIDSRNSIIIIPIIFCVIILMILLFNLAALGYYIHKRLTVLFSALENIKPESVKARIDKLLEFKNRFDKNLQDPKFTQDILEVFEHRRQTKRGKEDKEIDRRKFRPQDNDYMKSINLRLLLSYISGALLCITLGVVLFTNYTASLNYQQTYYGKVRKMFTVFDILYNNPFSSSNLISWMVFYNNTEMTVQSETQQECLQFNIEALAHSEEELYDIFTDGTGTMQYPVAGPLLESNMCEFVEEYQEYCQELSAGRKFGLIDMINLQLDTIRNFEQLFEQSPTFSNAQQVMNMMEQTDNKQLLVSYEANTYLQWYLYDQIHVIAEGLIQQEIYDAIIYSCISWVIFVVLSFTTFYFFNYYDNIKFRLVSILPLEIIQQNRILQFYFINELGAMNKQGR